MLVCCTVYACKSYVYHKDFDSYVSLFAYLGDGLAC
jgi:hypothetical protein